MDASLGRNRETFDISWKITLIKRVELRGERERERNNFLARQGVPRSWEPNGKLLLLSSVRLDNLPLVCLFCRFASSEDNTECGDSGGGEGLSSPRIRNFG